MCATSSPARWSSSTTTGVRSLNPFPNPMHRLCIFEYVYFARPDSMVEHKNVYQVRKAIGGELARESPVKADLVVPVPDSGVPGAIGYSEASGIPFELGIIRKPLRRPHLHRAVGFGAPPRRQAQAQRQHGGAHGQARDPGRRLHRARHHLEKDRRHGARGRRQGSAHAHRQPADDAFLLLPASTRPSARSSSPRSTTSPRWPR